MLILSEKCIFCPGLYAHWLRPFLNLRKPFWGHKMFKIFYPFSRIQKFSRTVRNQKVFGALGATACSRPRRRLCASRSSPSATQWPAVEPPRTKVLEGAAKKIDEICGSRQNADNWMVDMNYFKDSM